MARLEEAKGCQHSQRLWRPIVDHNVQSLEKNEPPLILTKSIGLDEIRFESSKYILESTMFILLGLLRL